jgi:uncharacterized protein (DUF983 family)
MAKRKGIKDKCITQKTKARAACTPLKAGYELMCPRNGVFKLFLNSNTPPDKKKHMKMRKLKKLPQTNQYHARETKTG